MYLGRVLKMRVMEALQSLKSSLVAAFFAMVSVV
jgi:hypothetical protein